MSLTINSFNNNAISSLFSTSSNSSVNSIFGGLETSLTDFSQIRSGTYAKLVKSYYSKYDSDGTIKGDKSAKSKEDSSNLNQIRNDASDLSKATDKLLGKGSKLWDKI